MPYSASESWQRKWLPRNPLCCASIVGTCCECLTIHQSSNRSRLSPATSSSRSRVSRLQFLLADRYAHPLPQPRLRLPCIQLDQAFHRPHVERRGGLFEDGAARVVPVCDAEDAAGPALAGGGVVFDDGRL